MKDNKKLLDVLEKAKTKREIEEILLESTDEELLYHFSEVRENILNWYPFDGTESFLEIGSECGALTGMLCEKVGNVVAVETDSIMNEVNKKRNENHENLEIFDKTVDELREKTYQYISLIGTLERIEKYFGSSDVEGFLARIKSILEENGTLFIAVDNKFSMAKWSGCDKSNAEEGLESFDKGYSYRELKEILEKAGFEEIKFLFPNPDYEFPLEIFDESRVPKSGFLKSPLASYYSERMITFDEMKAFDAVCKEGRFKEFTNSFLILCK